MLFFNISSPLTPTFGCRKHWLLVIENNTDYAWSYFLKSKVKNVMLALIKTLKAKYDIQIRYTQCNNARENEDFESICKQEGMGIEFECTAPSMPQQNGHVEHKFTTLFNKVHAMLNGGKFSSFLTNS